MFTDLRIPWGRLAALVAVALLLSGCGRSAESQFVGTWEIDREAFREALDEQLEQIANPGERAFAQAMMAAIIAEASGTIEFRQDGTFAVEMRMMDETMRESGTWTAQGNSVTMEGVDERGNKDVTTGHVEGRLLRLAPDDPDDPPVVFRKR
jgi:hypothetical protein